MQPAIRTTLGILFCSASLQAQAPLPRVATNDNRVPAGVLKDGVLTLKLDIVRGVWYPDRADDPGIDLPVFAESGRAPSAPGPLIRVPVGTEIRTSVHNTIDESIVVFGLTGERTPADTLRVPPGETREFATHAHSAGTFLYYGMSAVRTESDGDDHLLRGAFVVDEPGVPADDRVIVLLQYIDKTRVKPFPGTVAEINTFNGKTWPNTERLTYDVTDTIRWRIINGTMHTHAMHLHGAYYTVLSHGDAGRDVRYETAQRPQVVTERMPPFTTMRMQWTPVHAGNWVFHCHITPHIRAHPPLGPMKASADHEHLSEMAGMVMGIVVRGPIAADPKPARKIRLVVNQFSMREGENVAPMSYALDQDATEPRTPGPTIFLTRDQPTAITVVNHAEQSTAVHWHGLEIQSYYDGVHGFGGHGDQIAPHIAPGDSFVAMITAPRAGTFMYHTHFNEGPQQRGGLAGALIVLEPGAKWNAEHERLVLISSNRRALGELSINGQSQTTFHMIEGETYRLRFMQIHIGASNMVATLTDGTAPLQWSVVARDGFDLPIAQRSMQPALLTIGPGQTYDALFTAPRAGAYQLLLRSVTVEGEPVSSNSKIIVEARK